MESSNRRCVERRDVSCEPVPPAVSLPRQKPIAAAERFVQVSDRLIAGTYQGSGAYNICCPPGLQRGDGSEHGIGERHFGLRSLFAFWVFALESLALIVLGLLLFIVVRLRTFGFGLTLGHPWLSDGVLVVETHNIVRAAFSTRSIDASSGADIP